MNPLPYITRHDGNHYLGCVYAIKNLANGRMYIGSTTRPDNRIQQHLSRLKSGKHPSKELQQDFTLYGKENFVTEVVKSFSHQYWGHLYYMVMDEERNVIKSMRPHYNTQNKAA